METEPGANRGESAVDWLASHPGLPHLFAHLSELVHLHGYAPEDLVVLPRSEVDRRETAAFTGGWAEAVSDELPRIRREYEKRVADAYAQGQGDARGIRRPQRRTDTGQEGARVIALPFARLLEPPAALVEAEERVRRERELFEQRPESRPEPDGGPSGGPSDGPYGGPDAAPEDTRPEGVQPDPESEVLVTAQESRARRNAQPVRKIVRGKGGRPIVPPLAGAPAPVSVPFQSGPSGDRRTPDAEPGRPEPRARKPRRLSERARALEEDMAAERAQEAPPEPTP